MNYSQALIGGMLLTLASGPLAWGQVPPRRPTMGERISALGRALTGSNDSDEEETADAAESKATPAARPGAEFPQVDAKSLLPSNRYGTRPGAAPHGQRAATGPSPQGQPGQSRAGSNLISRTPATGSATTADTGLPRTAQRNVPGRTVQDEAFEEHYVLPGLGGSPLPGSARNTIGNAVESSLAPAGDASQSFSTNPSGSGSDRSFPSAASAAASARSSPTRRAPTHVDASELRHELAGDFPQPRSTTPVEPPHEGGTVPSDSAGRSTSDGFGAEPRPQENIFTLPVADDPAIGGPSQRFETTAPVAPSTAAQPFPFDANQKFEEVPSTATPSSAGPFRGVATPSQRSGAAAPGAGRRIFGEVPAQAGEANVLVMNQAPIISTDISGPKQIVVGREASFHVRVHNQGNAAADGIDVSVRVPSWAGVVGTSATNGNVAQAPTSEVSGVLKWQIVRLEAGATESLELRLVPRSSRPLELGVNWSVTPVASRAVVEVQEPKLEMNVSGPDEVLFGRPQTYRFTLTNPGTGVAENVRIELYPPGGGDKPAGTNQVGNLPPGKSQTIEVELIARDPGKLAIKAVAAAEGELTCTAIKDVFCRKPELAVDWRGPDAKYAGTEATYFIRVRNPGTAPAEDVTVRATLPEGAQLTSASEGQVYDAARREVAWRVGSLGPGDDHYMELKCNVTTAGKNQLKLAAATAAGDLSDSKIAETNVIALADLKLEVSDPSGPVAISDEAIYEIRIQNRGASAAREINVVALFSAGVEPVHAEGAQYTVSDGRVAFRAIDELGAGRQAVLKIRAKAVQPGTHVFRAEVLCRDLEIKLAAEETTRFFADDSAPNGDPNINQAGNSFDASTVR